MSHNLDRLKEMIDATLINIEASKNGLYKPMKVAELNGKEQALLYVIGLIEALKKENQHD